MDCVPVHKQGLVHDQLRYAAEFAVVQPGAFIGAYGIITGANSQPSWSLKGMIIMYCPAQWLTNRVECSFSHLKEEAGGFATII